MQVNEVEFYVTKYMLQKFQWVSELVVSRHN